MKSEIVNLQVKEITYPILMQHKDGYVVFFITRNQGVVVHRTREDQYPIGYYDNNWVESTSSYIWTPLALNKSVTLSND